MQDRCELADDETFGLLVDTAGSLLSAMGKKRKESDSSEAKARQLFSMVFDAKYSGRPSAYEKEKGKERKKRKGRGPKMSICSVFNR